MIGVYSLTIYDLAAEVYVDVVFVAIAKDTILNQTAGTDNYAAVFMQISPGLNADNLNTI